MTLVPIDYFDDLDHRYVPRLRRQTNWSRTGTALAAVLLSISALIFALLLSQSGLSEGSSVVLRLDPQPAQPAHVTEEPAWEGITIEPALEEQALPRSKPQVIEVAKTQSVAPPAATRSKPKPAKSIVLTAAPIARLNAPSPDGPLPQVATDGTRPIEGYARPFDKTDTRPRIYLVIGGLGFFPEATNEAIEKLPDAITLGFVPFGDNLQAAVNKARAGGHEAVLEVPMEPFGMAQNDPGPNTLLVGATREENLRNLHWLMSRTSGYVGIVNYLGARFMSQPDALIPILQETRDRGLLILDDGSSQRSQVANLAASQQTPWAVSQRTIDATPSLSAIDENLISLEALAEHTGSVVATAYAYPLTLERVALWAKTLDEKGIVLAPLSAHILSPKETSFPN